MQKIKKKIIILSISLSAIFSLAFVDNYFEISKNLDIMTTAYRELNMYYVDDIDAAKLMRTGIEAMVESLDPYTNYISESEIEDLQVEIAELKERIEELENQLNESINKKNIKRI